ncbi:MAG: hypothetical protein AB8F74_10535 [Saprospiraceae bacterium]
MIKEKTNIDSKILFALGTIAYAVMTLMAIVLYKERIAFLDGSYILFSILSEGDLAVQVYRFGSAVTQAVPLLASKMDFSLEAVMKLYSASFPLYFYLMFLACLLLLKKKKHAILLLLFNVGMITHTFYWVIPEFQQGLSLLVLYFALLEKSMDQGWLKNIGFQILNLFLISTLVFFHPLMVFPFGFFVAYYYFFLYPTRKDLLFSSLAFLFFFFIKAFLFNTTYERNSVSGLKHLLLLFPDYFTTETNINFLTYLFKDYYLLLLALIAISVHFVRNDKKLQLAFTLVSFFAYLALINTTFPFGPSQFYIESLYLPLSLIVFFPLLFDVFKNQKGKVLLIGLSLVVGIRLIHIYNTSEIYTDRVEYISGLINKTENLPNKKLLLSPEQLDKEKMLLTWGFSYESWLISTIENGATRSFFSKELGAEQEEIDYSYVLGINKAFATAWGSYPYEKLPEQYFIFKDTSYYVELKEEIDIEQ